MFKKLLRSNSSNLRPNRKSFRGFESLEDRAMMTGMNSSPEIYAQYFVADLGDAGQAPLGTIFATDAESAVTFEILSGNDNNYFAVDSTTGDLSLVNAPPNIIPFKYELDVKVTDVDGLSATATITVVFKIQAEMIGGVYVITGTNQDDNFEIKQIQGLPDQYQIVLRFPDGSFQGTGEIVPQRKIKIDLRGGNDTLIVGSGVNINDLEIIGGTGNDQILLGANHTEAWSNDVRSPGYGFGGYMLVKDRLQIDTGEGNDQIFQRFTYNPSDVIITMGDGDDLYDLYGGFVSGTPDPSGEMSIDTGIGNDQVKIGYLSCNPVAIIDLGEDNDLLSIYATQFFKTAVFRGSVGADTLALDVNRYDGNVDVDTGDGSDYLLFSRSVFADQAKLVTGLGSDTLLIGKYIAGLSSNGSVNYEDAGSTGKSLKIFSDLEDEDGGDADTATIAANSLETLFAEFGDGDDVLSMENNFLSLSGAVDGGTGKNLLKVRGVATFATANFIIDDEIKDAG